MQRKLLALGMLLGFAVALAACAAEEAKPAAPAPAAPAAKPAWEQEWERVVAAAKQEGKIAVSGQAGRERRLALTKPFEDKYGITVEYFGDGRDWAERYKTERAAGQYLWDIAISGGNSFLRALGPLGAMEPIEPHLILPDFKNPKLWYGGELTFFDKERRMINMFASKSPIVTHNPNFVKAQEIKSYKDLLNPKFKGKMVADDPSVPGPGRAKWRFFAAHPDLGADFVKALLAQEIKFTRNEEIAIQWVIAGRYPVCIGCSEALATPKRKEGLPIHPLVAKEGNSISGGWGQVTLLNKAPHPNAAKLYLNWLFTKEAQAVIAPSGPYASLRLDVPTDYLEFPWHLPKEGEIRLDTDARQRKAESIIRPIFKEFFKGPQE